MRIFIKATNLSLTEPLKIYINDKLSGLSRMLARFNSDIVKAQIEIGRVSRHHKKGDVYRAEVNMELPQEILRAEESNTNVRAAIDAVKDKLKREIESYLSRHIKDHR
jgi:putative sigma-54 modulation protein